MVVPEALVMRTRPICLGGQHPTSEIQPSFRLLIGVLVVFN